MKGHRFAGIAFMLICLIGRPVSAPAAQSVKVFAAASLTGAIQNLADLYQSRHHMRISAVFASSSTLAKQIMNGAPADIYLSANQDWMDRVERTGHTLPGSRFSLLGNQLTLIAPASSPVSLDLTAPNAILIALRGGRLAMGDPDHVPAGIYGKAALKTLGQWRSVKDRIAAAPDVRAALAYVERGEVNLGVVYSSDTVGRRKIVVAAIFPPSSHPPIIYPIARIKGRQNDKIERFYQFLKSREARAVFTQFGFSQP